MNAVHAAKSTEGVNSAIHQKKMIENLQEMEGFSYLKKCRRLPHWIRQEEEYGASAFIDLDQENLKDFFMEKDLNYEMLCPRIFLNIKKLTDSSFNSPVYKGRFVVAYDDIITSMEKGTAILYFNGPDLRSDSFEIIIARGNVETVEYSSGETVEDNQFNTWQGDWQTLDVNFAAIF